MKVAILAAGKSSRIFNKIKKNKCMINVNGNALIFDTIDKLISTNLIKESDIYVVTGFRSKSLEAFIKKKFKNIKFIYNKFYNKKEMLYSMILAMKKINENFLCVYSDILINSENIKKLIISRGNKNIKIPILKNWQKIWRLRKLPIRDDAEDLHYDKKKMLLKSIGTKIYKKLPKYQYMGIIYFPKILFKRIYLLYSKIEENKKPHLTWFLNYLIKNNFKIFGLPTSCFWYEFDNYNDYINFLKIKKY